MDVAAHLTHNAPLAPLEPVRTAVVRKSARTPEVIKHLLPFTM